MMIVKQHINRPVEAVFAACTDLRRAPDRISAITKVEILTDGPIGEGTRFRETRIMFRKEASEEMTIVEFVPNDRYVMTAESCGCRYRTTFRFRPVGEGTEVEMEFLAKPVTLLARIVAPMMFFMSGMVRKCVEQDLKDLKAFLESRPDKNPVQQGVATS